MAPGSLAIVWITFFPDLGVAMPVEVCQALGEHQHQLACLLSIKFIKQFEQLLLWVALATLWLEGEEFLNAVGCVGDCDRVSSLCLRYNYGTPAGVLQGGLCHLFNCHTRAPFARLCGGMGGFPLPWSLEDDKLWSISELSFSIPSKPSPPGWFCNPQDCFPIPLSEEWVFIPSPIPEDIRGGDIITPGERVVSYPGFNNLFQLLPGGRVCREGIPYPVDFIPLGFSEINCVISNSNPFLIRDGRGGCLGCLHKPAC